MKTVVIQFLIAGAGGASRLVINPTTGKQENVAIPLTAVEIEQSKKWLLDNRSNWTGEIKRQLTNAGFIVDQSLWKWFTTVKNERVYLWLQLTFEDPDNLGSNTFMADISKTGFFRWDYKIVKKYG